MSRALAVLLVAGALSCSGRGLVLSQDWPTGVPAAREVDGWERIDGDVETSQGRAVYALYVDPQRAGLYSVTRYHLRWNRPGNLQRTETEKYIWLRRRELGLPVCFERRDDGTWHELLAQSEAYQAEMLTAMAVYQLHGAARPRR